MAAVLACGEGAALSHEAAAELWQIRQSREKGTASRTIDITIPSHRGVVPRSALVVHRVPTLRPEETTKRAGICVTTPARTVLDLATALPRRQLERTVDEAERLRLCRHEDLEAIVELHAGRVGAGALGRVLASHRAVSTVTRSELEERFLALCRKRRLPKPQLNVSLFDCVVDFLWPDAALVVEVDGHASHGTRHAFQADRDRDGRLAVSVRGELPVI
jgi:hypothetical protein